MPKRIRSSEYLSWQRHHMSKKSKDRKLKALTFLGEICIKCGTRESLELDHIDRKNKTFAISRPPSEKAFWEELKKCQILCKKCHKEKTIQENRGEKCSHAKLNELQVLEILIKSSKGIRGIDLANEYNILPMQVSRIKNRKTWKHIHASQETI